MVMNSSVRRKRLACAECTRRKIKCDKVLPCRNCRHRGNTCYRSESSPRLRTDASSRSFHHNDDPAELTGILAACLNDLQATLQEVRAREAAVPNINDRAGCSSDRDASTIPAPSEVQDVNSNCETAEAEDAATILEFLAWGKRKVPDFDELHDPSAPSQSPVDIDVSLYEPADPPSLRLTDDPSSLPVLQLLLPEPPTLFQMVNYHCECLLWYHTSFHGGSFQEQVDQFLKQQGRIDDPRIDLQWTALLFAVLAGSMTCAPRQVTISWGFEDRERVTLAHRLFKGALICLNVADYTARHSLYGIQCIATMTISAHLLGHSNSHAVKLASAVRIAQSLGMHRLGAETDDHPSSRTRREIGRRLWTELCIQDWFSIPFSESYLIHRRDFNTQKPQNCIDDDDMVPLPDDKPTLVTYHRCLYDIATIMPRLHNDLSSSHTLFAKYEHVIRYDTQMRTLVSKHMPSCLRSNTLDPSWPRYIPWARHCLAISSAHKIIMIHRKFLWSSFTNPAFTFTRKTCIAAAKTIIREQKQVLKEDGPVLWIYHAFSVAAGIILCLDLFFEPHPESDQRDHRELANDTIEILSHCETSMIATRGVKILRLLLQLEQDRGRASSAWDIRSLVQSFCSQDASVSRSGSSKPTERPSDTAGLSPTAALPFSADMYSSFPFPSSGPGIHDSLEDILLFVQNGGS